MCVMRFRWKRNKKSLCCISLGLFSVTIYWIFSNNVEVFGKQYTCEELRAKERVRQLVSDNLHNKEMKIKAGSK